MDLDALIALFAQARNPPPSPRLHFAADCRTPGWKKETIRIFRSDDRASTLSSVEFPFESQRLCLRSMSPLADNMRYWFVAKADLWKLKVLRGRNDRLRRAPMHCGGFPSQLGGFA